MNENAKAQMAKELTLKAMETNLIALPAAERHDVEKAAQAVANFFNAVLKNIQC